MTQAELAHRNARIITRYRSGETLLAIGSEFGLTKMRISQIVRARGLTKRDGGAYVRRRLVAQSKEKVQPDFAGALDSAV